MSSNVTYTSQQVNNLSNSSIWKNSIKNVPSVSKNNTSKYTLYATGDADLNGRKYISLPSNKVLTDYEKRKYNIW